MRATKPKAEGAREERAAIRRLIRSYMRRVQPRGTQESGEKWEAANEILRLIQTHVSRASAIPGGYGRK